MTPIYDAQRHEGDENAPNDPVHHVAQAMLKSWEEHPESKGIKVIAFVTEDRGGRNYATTALGGYDDDAEAFTVMMLHMQALAQANGFQMEFFPMPRPMGGDE